MTDHGFIPLGKYSSARDSMLHYLCMAEWSNESTGNSEAPTGFFWRISNDLADVHIPNIQINSVLEDWFEQNPEVTDSPELRSELVGHFIVSENSQGFINVASYATEKELLAAYQALEDEFNAWDSEEEEESDAPKLGDLYS